MEACKLKGILPPVSTIRSNFIAKDSPNLCDVCTCTTFMHKMYSSDAEQSKNMNYKLNIRRILLAGAHS